MVRIVALSFFLLVGVSVAQEPASKFEKLWADLADRNETRATRAALALASTPKETVNFLRSVMKPVKLEVARFKALLKDLDADEFDTRDRAYRELEYYGKSIRPQLEEEAKTQGSAEVRNQLARLIDASRAAEDLPPAQPQALQGRSISMQTIGGQMKIFVDGKQLDLTPKLIEKPGPQPSWLRSARASAVLEHIGTPEARLLLKEMAAGDAESLPTKSAKEALDRLNQ